MADDMDKQQAPVARRPYAGRPWLGLAALSAVILLVAGAFAAGAHRRAAIRSIGAFDRGYMMGGRLDERPGDHGGMPMMGGGYRYEYGAPAQGDRLVGGVVSISGNTLSVRISGSNTTVTVSGSTSFYKQGAVAKQSDLQVGDVVVVTGTPDSSGTVAATSISIR